MPSTSNKAIAKLLKQVTDPEVIEILQALTDIADASIILDNFINAFITKSVKKKDGNYWLHGHYTLGGTVSGRLSSSDPNLMNMPSSGTKYSKLIKQCIKPPKGKLLVGADFNALEARISALTTKDPAKLLVYTDGYDSHSLMAYTYFKDTLPDIIQANSDDKCFKIITDTGLEIPVMASDSLEDADGNLVLVSDLVSS
jgi:DNA polymerase-1